MSVSNDVEPDYNNEVLYDLKVEFIIRALDSDEVKSDKLLITNIKQAHSFELAFDAINDDRELPKLLARNRVPIIKNDRTKVQNYLIRQYDELCEHNQIKYRHARLGWYSYEDNDLFLLKHNTINNTVSECCREGFKFQSGNIDIYNALLDDVIYKNVNLSLAVVIGFTAVVVSRLKDKLDIGTIICNFSGLTSTGKSTAAMLLASLFAAPNKDGLLFKFNATGNALAARLAGINGLPMVIDDILVNEKIDISELIYSFADGSNKDRCDSNGKIRNDSNDSFSGVIVLTSEYPILECGNKNQGLLVRSLAMNDIGWTPDSQTANFIKQTVLYNYGWVGEQFANYIASITIDDLYQRYLNAKAQLHKIMPNLGGFTDRLENQYAAIYLTVLLVNKCFNKKLNADELLKICLQSGETSIQQNDNAEIALEAVKAFILTHKQNFIQIKLRVTTPNFSNYYGSIEIDCLDNIDVYIMNEYVDSIISKAGIRDKISVKRKWKEKGIIKGEKGRYDCKYRGCYIKSKWHTHFIFTDNSLLEEIEDESPFDTDEQLTIKEHLPEISYSLNSKDLVLLNQNFDSEVQIEYSISTPLSAIPLNTNNSDNRENLND